MFVFQQLHNLGRRFCASKMHLILPEALIAVRSKLVVLLLLINCLMYTLLLVGALCLVFIMICIT